MELAFTSSKFRTRLQLLAVLAAVCLPNIAHANSGTVMMVGATVLPPACVATADNARVAVKCAGPYSYVTKTENDTMAGQGTAAQRPTISRTEMSNSGQRRLTVTY